MLTSADACAASCAAADGVFDLVKYQSKIQVISCDFDECSKCEYEVSIRQHMSFLYQYGKCEYVMKSAYVSIRQHTPAYLILV
jgi:hypothetical protein